MAQLTEVQAERLAKKAAHEAVEELLQKLGVDTADVLEMQKDFAHLRAQRQASEQVTIWTRRILLGLFLSSAIGILLAGVKAGLGIKP